MSKQWGHVFHQGKMALVIDELTRTKEYGIAAWIQELRAGEVIFRRDWDGDSKRLFMNKNELFVCENGEAKPYKISETDLRLEWFGFADI